MGKCGSGPWGCRMGSRPTFGCRYRGTERSERPSCPTNLPSRRPAVCIKLNTRDRAVPEPSRGEGRATDACPGIGNHPTQTPDRDAHFAVDGPERTDYDP